MTTCHAALLKPETPSGMLLIGTNPCPVKLCCNMCDSLLTFICVSAAMSLAAEDDEQGRRLLAMDPCVRMQFPSNRHRQPYIRSGASFSQPYSSRSDPVASIAHSLVGGGSPFDEEILAALMADLDSAAIAHAGSTASGSGQQDLSYEALTNLEDVKLTAPPELLATMPLDMCLKGGQWRDKVQSTSGFSLKARHRIFLATGVLRLIQGLCCIDLHICAVGRAGLHPACLQCLIHSWYVQRHRESMLAHACVIYSAQKVHVLKYIYTLNGVCAGMLNMPVRV